MSLKYYHVICMLTFLPFLFILLCFFFFWFVCETLRGLGDFVCMISCKFSLMYVIVWKREFLPNEMYIFWFFVVRLWQVMGYG